jgi:flavin-dependent dehydrogenase
VRASYDIVIVGARPAAASLAIHLARAGARVALLDRVTFPADTISTHVIYPNTLARLEALGALTAIEAHSPPPLHTGWHHRDASFQSAHTPVAGRDYALCVRRVTLDAILVEAARRSGAHVHENFAVTATLGRGSDEDPVRGVVGRASERSVVLHAPLVVGADGRHSTVAQVVGAAPALAIHSQTMMLYAYWRGLPATGRQDFFHDLPWIGTHFPADDGFHAVALIGPISAYPRLQRQEFYSRRVSAIAGLGDRVSGGRQVGKVIGTRTLDGYYRQASGAGWVLTGDAGHFKHPAAVQGIGDALHSAAELAPMILAGEQRERFPRWRDEATREMYAFSRFAAAVPAERVLAAIMRAAAADPGFARDLVDIWSRAARPWAVIPRVPEFLAAAGASPGAVLAELTSQRTAA